MVISLHDVPGTFVSDPITIPKQANAELADFVVFRAPFKCKVTKVLVTTGANWAGVNDATNHNRFVLLDVGVGGTATPSGLGTISGSPTGTVLTAYQPGTLYSGTLSCEANHELVFRVGTVGTGTTAAPAAACIVEFIGA